MKQITHIFLALFLLCLILCACGGKNLPVVTEDTTSTATETEAPVSLPTAAALAENVASTCSFSEALSANDSYLSHHLFDFASLSDRYEDSAAYIPVGITPEEVLVFIAVDERGAKALCDKLEDYIDYQRSEYGDYKPSEVPKLDGAVVAREGRAVVYVVSTDNDAAADAVNTILANLK